MKKVLFIFPNTANRPLISMAIPILMGVAKNSGWEYRYFDTSNYNKEKDSVQDREFCGEFVMRPKDVRIFVKPFESIVTDLQKCIDDFDPDIIAITAMTCDYDFLMTFWSEVKTKALRIIGGFHATVLPHEIISTGLFDIACIGRGEHTFKDILDGKGLKDISGICFDDGNEIVTTEKRNLYSSDEVWSIDPDYSMFDHSYFEFPFDGNMIKMCQIESSRGCPYHCSYCGNDVLRNYYKRSGKFLIVRPFDSLFELVEKMISQHNIELISFTDECFMGRSVTWLKEFCERWKDIRKPFLIQTRPEFVKRNTLEMLIGSGAPFIQIGMGVESGSPRILKDICDRNVDINKTIAAYDLMHEYPEIRTNAYFMVGFPTETREEMFETIKLCRRINSKVNSVAIYQPFPGQRLRDYCVEQGYLDKNSKMSTFTGNSVLTQPHISSKEISKIRNCFILYAKLPFESYTDIEKCENDFENNVELFKELVAKRWENESK